MNRDVSAMQLNNIRYKTANNIVISNSVAIADLINGNTVLIKSSVILPSLMMFGDFTDGDQAVRNIHAGDNDGSILGDNFSLRDILCGPDHIVGAGLWPIRGQVSIDGLKIGVKKTATSPAVPGELVLSAPAVATGRFPIFPIPVY
jgi:hypothetical protein